jgi:hypothetical protein
VCSKDLSEFVACALVFLVQFVGYETRNPTWIVCCIFLDLKKSAFDENWVI